MATYVQNISPTDVRNLSNVSSEDISDSQITIIISGVVSQLNADILVRNDDWRVISIDDWRNNKVDGVNTIFYVPESAKYIGDYDDDGIIGPNDVTAYYIYPANNSDSSSSRVEITVSTITDPKIGKITLSSPPPSTGRFYLSWASSPIDMSVPHPLIKRAIIQLASAMCYSYVDVGKVSKFRVGKVDVLEQSQAYKKYMEDYKRTITQILSKAVMRKDFELI